MRRSKKLPKWAVIVILIAAIAVYAVDYFTQDRVTEPMDGLYVHFIDIGQGDASLIVCDGKTMLIDGGEVDEADRLVDYLERQGVKTLDYAVCTHSHADHCGGLDKAIERFGAETVFTSPYTTEINQYKQVLEAADEVGAELCVPDFGAEYRLGEAVFTFIGPVEEYSDTNNNSLVLRLTYGDKSFLFTGDMEREAENDLLDSGVKLSSDVLKVGHHGSSTSTSYRFLYEVSPEIAVISCGEDNSYGHPHEEVLSRLSDADVTVYRTDLDGSVVLFCDGMKVTKK